MNTSRESHASDYESFYPTTLVLAIMCKHSYEEGGKVLLSEGFVKIFKCKGEDGYNGAAFLHEEKKQLVIGHGGTEAIKDYFADVQGVGFQRHTSQVNSAYIFSAYVINEYKGKVLIVSITGHSLGGWLAQTTALYLKDCAIAKKCKLREVNGLQIDNVQNGEKIDPANLDVIPKSVHVHVVSFDSPGCRHFLVDCYKTHHKCQAEGEDVIRKLDITIYFTHPNYVNSYATHVGRLFSLYELVEKKKNGSHRGWFKSILKYWKNYKYTLAVHDIGKIIETIEKLNESNGSMNEILDWGRTINSSVEFNEGIQSDNYEIGKVNLETLPLANFDDEEYNFLLSISVLHMAKNMKFDNYKKMFEVIDGKALKFEISLECFCRTKIAFDIHILSEGLNPAMFVNYWKRWMIENRSLVESLKHPSYYVAQYGRPAEYMQLAEMVVAPNSESSFVRELKQFTNSDEPTLVVKHDPDGNTFQATAQVYALVKKFTNADVLGVNFKILAVMAKSIGTHTEKNNFSTFYIVEQLKVNEQQIVEEQTDLSKQISKFDSSPKKKIIFVRKANLKIDFIVDGRIKFDHLSTDGQSKILNAKVNFQGSEGTLKRLLNNEDDTLDTQLFQILVDNPEILGKLLKSGAPEIHIGQSVSKAVSLLDAVAKYYMIRTFAKNVLRLRNHIKDEKAIKMPDEYPGFYLLTGNPTDVADQLKIHSSLVTRLESFPYNFTPPPGKFVFVTSQIDDELLQKIESQENNFHWFEYVTDKGFIWNASSLNEHNKLPEVKPIEEHCTEEVLIDSSKRVIVLGDEAGNGKTTMMFHFAKEAKKKVPNSWIIVTPLASISERFLKDFSRGVDLASIAAFFARFDSPFSESKDVCSLQILIFKILLQQNAKVSFYFDGFDEIPSKVQSIVIRIAQFIVNETKAKLRISSRFYAQTELEGSLGIFAVRMNPLTDVQKVDFLCRFWLAQPESIELNGEATTTFDVKAKNFANRTLAHINDTIKDDISKVLGIPLMLFMAGTVSLNSFIDNVRTDSSEDVTIFTSITDLYKSFIDSLFARALEKKFVQDSYLAWHHKAAFHYLSTSFIIDEEYKNAFEFIPHIDESMLALLSQIGLLQAQKMNIKFLHRSIAEYFTAEYLFYNLNHKFEVRRSMTLNFLKLNFFIPSFDKIRYFMDHLMAEYMSKEEGEDIFMAVLGDEISESNDNIGTLLSTNVPKDLLDRIPLCYFMARYSRVKKIESETLKSIVDVNLENVDSLGQYPLCYWPFDNKEGLRECFWTKKQNFQESSWKIVSIASLRGDSDFLSRNLLSSENETENRVKSRFDAIKLASYFKTQGHEECIQYIMMESSIVLYDYSTLKYLLDDKYQSCSDNLMQYATLEGEILMWLCCRKFCELERLLKLLKKSYCIPTNIPDYVEFPFKSDQIPYSYHRTVQHTQFAIYLLKNAEFSQIIRFDKSITNQECSALRLIQCALMTISLPGNLIKSTTHGLYFAFLTRIVALIRSDQVNEDYKLQVDRKDVPVHSIVWDSTSNSKLQQLPLLYIFFTIPYQDGDFRMQVKGKVEKRYEDIERSEFLYIYDKGDIDVYTIENVYYRRLRDDTFANETRISYTEPTVELVGEISLPDDYDEKDDLDDTDYSKPSPCVNLWISNKTGSLVKQFHTKDVKKLKVNTVATNDRFNHFDESLGAVLLNSANFFAIRNSPMKSKLFKRFIHTIRAKVFADVF